MSRKVLGLFCVCLTAVAAAPIVRTYLGDTNLPPLMNSTRTAINLVFLLLAGVYWTALLKPGPAVTNRCVIWTLAAALPLTVFWPVFSGDLWEYLMRGRILMLYHENPYTFFPERIPQDLLYPYIGWRFTGLVYGPLALVLQAAAACAFPVSMTLSALSFKLLLVPFWLWGCLSYRRLLGHDPDVSDPLRWAGWVMSPLVLVMTFLDGHNDIITTAACMAAFAFAWEGRGARALIAWTAGFAVKYHVVMLWPPLIALLAARLRYSKGLSWSGTVQTLAFLMAAQGAVIAAVFLPVPGIEVSFRQLAANTAIFYNNSVPYAAHAGLRALGVPLSEAGLAMVLKGGFVLVYGWALLEVLLAAKLSSARRLFVALALLHVAFYVHLPSPLNVWYLVWGLPWLILARFPLAHLLVPLYSFGALFGYFKRINFLLIIAAGIYAACLLADRSIRRAKHA